MSSRETRGPRTGFVTRRTAETDIELRLVLDGAGEADVQTGMLTTACLIPDRAGRRRPTWTATTRGAWAGACGPWATAGF